MCTTLQWVSITAHISTDTFPMHPILQQVLRVVCADNPQHRNGKYTGIVRVGRGALFHSSTTGKCINVWSEFSCMDMCLYWYNKCSAIICQHTHFYSSPLQLCVAMNYVMLYSHHHAFVCIHDIV